MNSVTGIKLGKKVPDDLEGFDGMCPWFTVSFGEHGEHASFIENE
jgi:hypothetical protein